MANRKYTSPTRVCRRCLQDLPMSAFKDPRWAAVNRYHTCYACRRAWSLRTEVERFWSKVNKESGRWWNGSQCWAWMAGTDQSGYGRFWTGKTHVGAHRYSYILANGPIPDGLNVLHHCDNPVCVNPSHHFLGTLVENIADMMAKGRHYSKLTTDDVREIRRRYGGGEMPHVIAVAYGLTPHYIGRIARRVIWRQVA